MNKSEVFEQSKLEEILQEHIDPNGPAIRAFEKLKGYEGIVDAMKAYAEYYAIECLNIAAESAKMEDYGSMTDDGWLPWVVIDKYSIREIELPGHN